MFKSKLYERELLAVKDVNESIALVKMELSKWKSLVSDETIRRSDELSKVTYKNAELERELQVVTETRVSYETRSKSQTDEWVNSRELDYQDLQKFAAKTTEVQKEIEVVAEYVAKETARSSGVSSELDVKRQEIVVERDQFNVSFAGEQGLLAEERVKTRALIMELNSIREGLLARVRTLETGHTHELRQRQLLVARIRNEISGLEAQLQAMGKAASEKQGWTQYKLEEEEVRRLQAQSDQLREYHTHEIQCCKNFMEKVAGSSQHLAVDIARVKDQVLADEAKIKETSYIYTTYKIEGSQGDNMEVGTSQFHIK